MLWFEVKSERGHEQGADLGVGRDVVADQSQDHHNHVLSHAHHVRACAFPPQPAQRKSRAWSRDRASNKEIRANRWNSPLRITEVPAGVQNKHEYSLLVESRELVPSYMTHQYP
jgi:hypothetical protein